MLQSLNYSLSNIANMSHKKIIISIFSILLVFANLAYLCCFFLPSLLFLLFGDGAIFGARTYPASNLELIFFTGILLFLLLLPVIIISLFGIIVYLFLSHILKIQK